MMTRAKRSRTKKPETIRLDFAKDWQQKGGFSMSDFKGKITYIIGVRNSG